MSFIFDKLKRVRTTGITTRMIKNQNGKSQRLTLYTQFSWTIFQHAMRFILELNYSVIQGEANDSTMQCSYPNGTTLYSKECQNEVFRNCNRFLLPYRSISLGLVSFVRLLVRVATNILTAGAGAIVARIFLLSERGTKHYSLQANLS